MGQRISSIFLKKLALFLVFGLGLTAIVYAQDDEPLMPQEAFKMRAYAENADTLRVEWRIVDGYYLYKEKFKFKSNSSGIELGNPSFPKGKVKEDEFFGKVETYRKKVVVDIPLIRAANSSPVLDLEVTSQGCADIGLCYPPQKEKVSLDLPPADEAGLGFSGLVKKPVSLLSSLGANSGQKEFLPPDQAFAFSAEVVDGNTVLASWKIAEGYYLYKDKFRFSVLNKDGVKVGDLALPEGKWKKDDAFGRVQVYYKQADIPLPLFRTKLESTELELRANFQGCADAGFCYPPMDKTTLLMLPAGGPGTGKVPEGLVQTAVISGTGSAVPLSEQDSIAATLANASIWTTILTFFGFGLLLAFTPCVFPMIPILSSIIVGQGKDLSTSKAFTMSLVYVLAMAVTYTIAGVIAGAAGANLQAAFQDPWILSIFAAVFIALAFSMFGFYDLQLPNALQSKLTELSNKQEGGTLFGVGIMGFLSALIVGPCVAAPLAGALIYISQTGDAVLGGVALFALSLGMGAPLLLIGTSAGKLLPKAGVWMDAIKAVFGVMLIGVAIWLLERIIPGEIAMALWAILLIVSAIYLGAMDSLHSGASGWKKLWKGAGRVMMVYGILLLIGASAGNVDPLQPLKGVFASSSAGTTSTAHAVEFIKVKSLDDLDAQIKKASAQNKPVMLDFYADWCVSCKEMERYTFSKGSVQQELSNFVLLQADVTANDEADKALLKKFGLIGPPSMLFFDSQGAEQRAFRLVGFLEADKFEAHIKRFQQS